MKENPNFTVIFPGPQNKVEASIVAQWTQKAGTMLPKTETEIMTNFQKGLAVLILNGMNELISHAAATYIWDDGAIEVGGLVTNPDRRREYGATLAIVSLLELLREKFPENKKFALANDVSAKLFEKLGAKKMTTAELSPNVWIPCSTCPKIPKQEDGKPFICCDTPYNLTDII